MGDLANASGKESDAIVNCEQAWALYENCFSLWNLPAAVFKGIPHQGKNVLNGSSVSWGWAAAGLEQRTLPPAPVPLPPPLLQLHPPQIQLSFRGPSGSQASLGWPRALRCFISFVCSLSPASQTELFMRMKAGFLNQIQLIEPGALSFQTHLANISVNAFRKVL